MPSKELWTGIKSSRKRLKDMVFRPSVVPLIIGCVTLGKSLDLSEQYHTSLTV